MNDKTKMYYIKQMISVEKQIKFHTDSLKRVQPTITRVIHDQRLTTITKLQRELANLRWKLNISQGD